MKIQVLVLILSFLAFLTGIQPKVVAAPTLSEFTVNTTVDQPDWNVGDGICAVANGSSSCSLRAAVMEASSLNQNFQLILPAGIYQLTIPRSSATDPGSGALKIYGSMTILGAGSSQTFISVNGAVDRVMMVGSGVSLSISGVSIQNGISFLNPQPDAGYEPGGGLFISSQADVKLFFCKVLNNQAGSGGGIYNLGSLELHDSAVAFNQSLIGTNGGGIYNSGLLTVQNTLIHNNSAYEGGGIYHDSPSTLLVNSSQIQDQPSGAALVLSGPAVIRDSTLSGNTQDGAIVFFGLQPSVELLITGSTISGNSAAPSIFYQRSGGITHRGGILTIENTTISGNSTTRSGGGILLEGGSASLYNVTITQNQAAAAGDLIENGGGIAVLGGGITLYNSILLGNFKYDQPGECSGNLGSGGYNLVSASSSCGLESDPTSVQAASAGLGPLQNNGGITFTQLPQRGSPAVDAGNPSGCAGQGTLLLHDQRGYPRIIGSRCDIGAVESPLYLFLSLVNKN